MNRNVISIHAPHAGRDGVNIKIIDKLILFQSTRPMRGATPQTAYAINDDGISIHAPHAGRDPSKGVTSYDPAISIHAPHAGRDFLCAEHNILYSISIHAPHAGRDWETCAYTARYVMISIHAPHAGRDPISLLVFPVFGLFQSTRPMRGATDCITSRIVARKNFNPRAPCGARRLPEYVTAPEEMISIHAPHAGRDSKSEQIALHIFAKKAWIPDIFAQNAAFQSVLPLADRQKLLYLRCEPLRKFLRAFASHYKIIGSSGR